MSAKRFGFSILELLLVLAITGLLIVCMTPALTRKQTPPDVTQKITCIPGQRIVVQNLYGDPDTSREGKITLPPGLDSFVLTMSGGGSGGGCAYVDSRSNGSKANAGGHGGGGGAFVYKKYVTFKLLPGAKAAPTVTYSIGGGGAGGVSEAKELNVTLYGIAGEDYKSECLPHAKAGGVSYFKLCNVDTNSCPKDFKRNGSCCMLTLNGGKASSGTFYSDPGSEIKDMHSPKEYFFGGSGQDVKTHTNIFSGSGGGYHAPSSLAKDSDIINGQDGETSLEVLPGLGGGSVFGVGSFGSGGTGGMNTMEKRFNIKRGYANFLRYGEDGIGGIMILEFDSICTNKKRES